MLVQQRKIAMIRLYLCMAVILIGVLVLCGWLFNIFILKSILSGYISMNPLTAVILILLAIGILLINKKSDLPSTTVTVIAFLVTAVMITKLADLFFATGFKPDKLLFSSRLGDNQMAEPTVFNFLFLAIALFFSGKKTAFAVTFFQLFTLLCLSLSSIYICAYIFNLHSIISVIATTPMALHSAIAFIFLSIALLLSKPNWGFMKTIMSPSVGGTITRKALPLVIFIPFIVGYASVLGQRKGLYNIEFGIAIFVITTAFLCGVIMLYYGRLVNKIHAEWKNTELNLRLSESKFSSAFNSSGIGMALVFVKGTWVDVNDALCNLLGYTKDEITALSFQEITHPKDVNRDVDDINKLVAGDINSYQTEKRFFHKNGMTVWIALTTSMVHDAKGLPDFFVNQMVDISQTKKLFVELETKNEVLSFTTQDLENKINQLEEFNRIVAHNLRGPVGSIQVLADMAIETTSEAERMEIIDMVKLSSVALNETLSQLMTVLEVKLNKNIIFDDCNVLEIIEKIEHMLKGEIFSKKAEITTSLESPMVKYPKVYLESIFYNMISNSLKYSKQDVPPIIHISCKTLNGNATLVFKDNGLGIDLVRYGNQVFKLKQIFHKGFDSKGVGLFMTKNQIETFGGTITIESKPDCGTEFTITL